MKELLREVRLGLRVLVRNRAFSAIVVLTLAVGIGATATLFGVTQAILLRPFPYPDSDSLAVLWESYVEKGYDELPLSGPGYLDHREQNRSFEELAGFRFIERTLTGVGEPENIQGVAVTPNFFDVFRLQMLRGRGFDPQAEAATSELVLSHALWRQRFGSDPEILGDVLSFNGRPYTVVGILPADMRLPPPMTMQGQSYNLEEGGKFFVPMSDSELAALERERRIIFVIGRLAADATAAAAEAEADAIAHRLVEAYPKINPEGLGAFVLPFQEQAVKPVMPILVALLIAVVLVLVIACVNVVNLLLVRGVQRSKEMALRSALGARRPRLFRQMLVESLVLGLAGGALGTVLAVWATGILAGLGLGWIPRLNEARVDGGVLGFVVLISVVVSVVVGLVPALRASRPNLAEGLNETARGVSLGAHRARLRKALVVIEIALTVALLGIAGLTLKSLWRLLEVERGFDIEALWTAAVELPEGEYQEPEEIRRVHGEILEKIRSLPGVAMAGSANGLPLSTFLDGIQYKVEGEEVPEDSEELQVAILRRVTPGYVEAMGIRQIEGRSFDGRDREDAQAVILVNEKLAQQHWPDQSPLGRRIKLSGQEGWATVVGVVGDVKLRGLSKDTEPAIYQPFAQNPEVKMMLVVRSPQSGPAMAATIRDRIWAVDSAIGVEVLSMDERVAQVLILPRLGVQFLVILAAVALLLGIIGVYGIVSHTVAQKRHEMAVRLALGARSGQVTLRILRFTLKLTAIGIAFGALGVVGLGILLAEVLFRVQPTDVWNLIAVSLILLAAAMISSYLPARRAGRQDLAAQLGTE